MTVTIRIAPESRDKDFVEDIMNQVTLLEGDCLQELKKLPGESVHCCVTAPPCWMGPDEGVNHRYIGMEQAPEQFILKLLHIFRELQRVLPRRLLLSSRRRGSLVSAGPHSRDAPFYSILPPSSTYP